LLLVVGATYVCWRRRNRAALFLALTIGIALVLAIVAIARVPGFVYEYRLQFTWMIAMAAMILVAWTIWTELVARVPRISDELLARITAVAIAVLSVANIVGVWRSAGLQEDESDIAGNLARDTEARLPPGDGEVVFAQLSLFFGDSVFLALERNGFDTRVLANPTFRYGDHDDRVHVDGAPLRATIRIVSDAELDQLRATPGAQLIAYWGTASLEDRTRLLAEVRRQRAIVESDYAAGRITAAQYVEKIDRIALLITPAFGGIAAVGVFVVH
jgi:hypothetical protein